MEVREQITDILATARSRGCVHARALGESTEVDVDADQRVVLASVFKVAVAVAYVRAVAAGRLDPAERTRVTAGDRIGGTGTAGCADDVELSWRDLARFMLTMSDNAATDVLLRRVGLDAVQAVLDDLGLVHTRIDGGCAEAFAGIAEELGGELPEGFHGIAPERLWALSALDPERTYASTARETTALLAGIWRDEVAPPAGCAEVRSLLAGQIWSHRLASGFPDGVKVASKTGTLLAIRNEVGVVTYPDGRQYAIAVFTVASSLDDRRPDLDAAIGAVARVAVEHLRDATPVSA